MLKRSGQAAGWLLHLLGEIVLGLALVVLVAISVLAWRLAVGPINLGFLVPRLSAALEGRPGGAHVQIGAASLAWEGFRRGIESPLELVLADMVLASGDDTGRVVIPRAEVSLSVPALLLGRIAPRRIVIEAPRLHLVLGKSGELAFFFGERRAAATPSPGTARLAGAILDALAAPPGNDRSEAAKRFPGLSELTTLTIRDADVTVVDQKLGATWFAPDAEIALERDWRGGLSGHARMALRLKDHPAVLSVEANLEAHRSMTIAAHLAAVRPSELAALVPSLGPLAAVDAPVGLEIDLAFGANLALENARLEADAGAGKVTFGGGQVPIESGVLKIASAGEDALNIREAVLHLAGPAGKAGPVLRATGAAFRDADGTWQGDLAFAVDAVPMADLDRYWPPDIARGGRRWVTENITGGVAKAARAAVRFALARGDDTPVIESAYAVVPGSGLVVHWLRPIPPLTDGTATLSIEGPDALSIAVQHASQGRLSVNGGTVTITGLEGPDQNATITAPVSGPLRDAMALLGEPRLGLLSRHPFPVSIDDGQSDSTVTITLPLLAYVTMDQVAVHAKSSLSQVRIDDIAGGFGVAGGTFSLDADSDGMELAGSCTLAGIPTRLRFTMDFRAGPRTAVNQRLQAQATVTAAELAQHGILDATELIDGPLALSVEIEIARDGASRMLLGAGLTEARLRIEPLGFVKPPGAEATARAEIAFARKRIQAINALAVTGTNISVTGGANFADGRPSFIRIDHAKIGGTDASGSVRFPGAGQPIAIVLQGASLDLSARFSHPAPSAPAPRLARTPATRGPPWMLDARFGRVLLAHGRTLTDCVLRAQSDGTMMTEVNLRGNLANGVPLSFDLVPEATGRALAIKTADAGDLLAALGITDRINGGTLTISARYDDLLAGRPLSGTANIANFRVMNAPGLGKVLQAMTLYGLADAMSGPGLGFSELIAPFELANDTLSLKDARAFSASLGLTLDGSIDLAAQTARLTGTVVPAYFFNSLLGRIPVIGRLFSPERGSGLFAATYSIDGPLADPRVAVNPLAAMTPGFLRGLFHIFD